MTLFPPRAALRCAVRSDILCCAGGFNAGTACLDAKGATAGDGTAILDFFWAVSLYCNVNVNNVNVRAAWLLSPLLNEGNHAGFALGMESNYYYYTTV